MPQTIERPPGQLVLVVDDMPENLAVLHDALDESGYSVVVANNGATALEQANALVPDVVLLDAVMPGMDGFEVCRRLKADLQTRAIPVIFMTGLTESEHVVAAFQAGGSDYVTKPVRQNEMLARIRAHTQNARLVSQARSALDAFGHAVLAVDPEERIIWQTRWRGNGWTSTSRPRRNQRCRRRYRPGCNAPCGHAPPARKRPHWSSPKARGA